MKIMVIDNHVFFREGVISLLKNQQNMEFVGESDVSGQAVQKALEWNPDVILMDMGFGHSDGVNVMKQILSHRPEISFIILTTNDSDEQFYEMIRNGAMGYLPKNINKPILLASLRALARGEAVIPRSRVTKILHEVTRLGKLALHAEKVKDFSILTYRELEVLKALVARATNREIAKQLAISENTVRVHVGNILGKLNLRNRREASEFVRRLDWMNYVSNADLGDNHPFIPGVES